MIGSDRRGRRGRRWRYDSGARLRQRTLAYADEALQRRGRTPGEPVVVEQQGLNPGDFGQVAGNGPVMPVFAVIYQFQVREILKGIGNWSGQLVAIDVQFPEMNGESYRLKDSRQEISPQALEEPLDV